MPLPDNAVDLIFFASVLHHTDSTRGALATVVRHLKVGGRILFYVYRKKDRSANSPTMRDAWSCGRASASNMPATP